MRVEINANVGPEDDLRELMGQPAGSNRPLELGEPFKVLPSGVYFAPGPHAWELLEPSEQYALAPRRGMGESVVADGVSPHWRRVMPFPFTAKQLLQFAEYALLPELCMWMERDHEDPAFGQLLSGSPRALALARFLAGGEDPDLPTNADVFAPGASAGGAAKAPNPLEEHERGERWTPEQLIAMAAYRNANGTKATAAHFSINESRVRALQPRGAKKATAPTANNPFRFGKGGARGSGQE